MQAWQVMKETTGKQEKKSSSLPKAVKTKQEIIEKKTKQFETKKLKQSKATGCDGLNGNINIDVCDSIETIFINC